MVRKQWKQVGRDGKEVGSEGKRGKEEWEGKWKGKDSVLPPPPKL